MTGKTHAIIGANAAWLALLQNVPPTHLVLFLIAGTIAGLLPDIDAQSAKIHHIGGGVLGIFGGAFAHRGFFHSLLATVILFAVSFWFLKDFDVLLPFVITLGYASHLLIDGLNFKATRYLFPLRREDHLVPKWLASPVGGVTDQLLFVFGGLGLLLFLFRHVLPLVQTGFSLGIQLQ
jgi:membrane-bound metal-dependent hydrolase YbcI (DUF457 family)